MVESCAHTNTVTIPHIALRELRETAKAPSPSIKSSPHESKITTVHQPQYVKVSEIAAIFSRGGSIVNLLHDRRSSHD